jgi:hypothetical protein
MPNEYKEIKYIPISLLKYENKERINEKEVLHFI